MSFLTKAASEDAGSLCALRVPIAGISSSGKMMQLRSRNTRALSGAMKRLPSRRPAFAGTATRAISTSSEMSMHDFSGLGPNDL